MTTHPLTGLSDVFGREGLWPQVAARLADGVERLCVDGVHGSAGALLAAQVCSALNRTVVVVAASDADASAIHDEVTFFRQVLPGPEVLLFPQPDTRPYENVLSHCDISAQRLWTLYRLCDSAGPLVVVTTLRAALQRVLPAELLIESSFQVRAGEECDRDSLCRQLGQIGYTRVSMVEDRGDFSVRGELLDLFPPGHAQPIRLDFFGNTVESIRSFDPATQRSCAELDEATVVPVRDVILSEPILAALHERIDGSDPGQTPATAREKRFFEHILNGLLPSGGEYCLSLLYPHLDCLADYLPPDAVVCLAGGRDAAAARARVSADVESHYAAAQEEGRVVSPPIELFVDCPAVETLAMPRQHLILDSWDIERPGTELIHARTMGNEDIRRDLISFDTPTGALTRLAEKMQVWLEESAQVCIVCHTRSQAERVRGLIADYGIDIEVRNPQDVWEQGRRGTVHVFPGDLPRGFRCEHGHLVLITEEEIFGEKRRRVKAPRFRGGGAISDFSDLKSGDYVVHRDNGIGVYRGLETLDAGGVRADYLTLEYLGGDRLYLPAARITLIEKYEHTDDTAPKLHKLGGTAWARTKRKVRESVEQVARDIVELYSTRKVCRGHAFNAPDHQLREFEAAFPYEETPDQVAAIQDVMRDMSAVMPMDRLICGDVGYGKTEVALRAAFRSAMEGKQVAVLVPTTVLAQQHYQTFRDRLAPYPLRVDIVSRFRSVRDRTAILQDLTAGKIDIIIGTHLLLGSRVAFHDLGLVVIDEEHRFGVKHKERLRHLRSSVDVLTLTATPIPRTLQLSLFGIRDFSLIETPPEDRLAIRTVTTHFDEGVIRDAVLRELKRGGQVFFVHDRVRSIPAMASFLRRLLPEMKLGVAHGQMSAHELERSMMQFVNGEINVLLCTTIIESGLDFPTANTIVINNAHRLGLAQMYQLRGRVGRGKTRAYAYLLVPGSRCMSRDAQKRLEAISEFSELGSGYRLATRDLQIRGAGNILGHSQSGHIAAVGVDMYLELLNEAIVNLRGEQVQVTIEPEINCAVQAFIPEEYVLDTGQRLVLYRRIAAAADEAQVRDLEDELRDRFGDEPEPVATLLEVARLKNLLRARKVETLDCIRGEIVFTFHESAGDDLDWILARVAADPGRFRLTPDGKLRAQSRVETGPEVLREAMSIMS